MNLTTKSKQFPKASGIYKITSPSNKIYIGQTINFQVRYYDYLVNPLKEQPRLKNSFNKYGFENHKFEIIEECSIEQLDERELYWGEYYNVLGKNGLVCRLGHGKGKLRNSTKNKISKSLMGKKQSKETIDKRVEKIKGRKASDLEKENKKKAKLDYFKNNKFTWGNKISESKQKNPFTPSKETIDKLKILNGKEIEQYNKHGILINTFVSSMEAMRITGIKNDNISQCLRGKSKSAGGYIWKYKK